MLFFYLNKVIFAVLAVSEMLNCYGSFFYINVHDMSKTAKYLVYSTTPLDVIEVIIILHYIEKLLTVYLKLYKPKL